MDNVVSNGRSWLRCIVGVVCVAAVAILGLPPSAAVGPSDGGFSSSVASLGLARSAAAGSVDFFSSFEANDPQPTWTDTVETTPDGNRKASGVTGPRPGGIPGDITDSVVAVRVSGKNPPNEVKENLIDGSEFTKWLVFSSSAWIEYELAEPAAVMVYALTSANDAPERDPRDWTFSGSNDGQIWTELDSRSGEDFAERFQTNINEFENTTAYRHYRLEITSNDSGPILQLAELRISDGGPPPPPAENMTSAIGDGPDAPYNAKREAGFTGLRALRYAGIHHVDERGFAFNRVFDVDIPVTPETELSYVIFPDFITDDLSYPSTYAAVDLAFTDGTYLSDLNAVDQHGATLSPDGQGRSKTLYADQWNFKRSRIGEVAAGKTIDRILVGYDNPDGPADFGGWVDDIVIDTSPPEDERSRPSDWVVTTRGTNSSSAFSRGNSIAAAAVPHGFNFWMPVTHSDQIFFLHEYHRDNNAQNLPELEALALSHEANPFMGDRQTFQVLPSSAADVPETGRAERALAYRHENENAKPYHYRVEFENGIVADIAPTDHAAIFRFQFPDENANLIFDNIDSRASVIIDADAGVVTGWSDVRSGLSNGATRMYIYAEFDRPITMADTSAAQTGFAKFDAGPDRTVTMRIATSLISLDQAQHNLELEIAPGDGFAEVRDRAQQLWDEKLDVIEVEGATEDQRTTLYSNLYRLFLSPNSAFENVGTNADPEYMHAVQSSASGAIPPGTTPTETGAPVVPGKVYVNNGFWDTYRAAWPAYSLLASADAGEFIDGFVQQYRDGGWVARWSSPGYANLMTGTSSDVSFADAFLKGVPGIDPVDTYNAALRNATVTPPGAVPFDTSIGRKGLVESIYRGYTSTRVSEGVSWALEGNINDFGIGKMAAALAADKETPAAERQRLREESEYFLDRAQNYVHMFDPEIEFFQGRTPDGEFKSGPEEYDPLVWGHDHDYTETNGWGFAFHVPHDGQGLANLYGGRDALAEKLDTFFSTPETGKLQGSYPIITHEMREARDVRMGQWGASNEVGHHIPYMYNYTGQPWKTQEKVREALRRLFVGSEIGQGYPGDDDSGSASAWYIFGALGFYPLQVGSPNYVIGSPLFKQATVDLGNGKELVIRAPNNSQENIYVQGLTVNGKRWDRAYLPHDEIADGGVLEFDMGPEPSSWATGPEAVPPSLTEGPQVPRPLADATGRDRGTALASADVDARPLFDNTAVTRVSLPGAEPWIEYRFRDDIRQRVRFYTLTSGEVDPAEDPSGWVLEGSKNGTAWRVLDRRDGEIFDWRAQTRPFKIERPGDFSRYRITLTGNGGADSTRLSEVEFMVGEDVIPTPLSLEVTDGVGFPGDTIPIEAMLTNDGDEALSGEVTATPPAGWMVQPPAIEFGPIAPGESQTVTFDITIPEGTERGLYPIEYAATSNGGPATATGQMDVAPITVAAVRTSGENPDFGEVKENLVDGQASTKWLTFTPTAWVELDLSEPFPIDNYSLTSANDAPERDPRDWILLGSSDGQTWTELDVQTGQDFENRFETKEYQFENTTAYQHYRLEITANHAGGIIQLAELSLLIDGRPALLPSSR